MNRLRDTTPGRYCVFPIRERVLWELYKKAEASFWTVEEVDLTTDQADWLALTPDERFFITRVLAFFASSDGIVTENLAVRFMADVTIQEARLFYGFQIAIEGIHAEMYSTLIDSYVRDPAEKQHLFNAIEEVPAVKAKAEWAIRWIEASGRSFQERLAAFACVEGIFFSGSFCAIFWLKKRGLMNGLTFSNELISRDEGLHTTFACELMKMLGDDAIDDAVLQNIVKSAVEVERQFVAEALPVALIGMNADTMCQYIRYVADHLMGQMGRAPIYGEPNPFDFMELISLQGKTNFFEKRVGEYQKANVCASGISKDMGTRVFSTDEDF